MPSNKLRGRVRQRRVFTLCVASVVLCTMAAAAMVWSASVATAKRHTTLGAGGREQIRLQPRSPQPRNDASGMLRGGVSKQGTLETGQPVPLYTSFHASAMGGRPTEGGEPSPLRNAAQRSDASVDSSLAEPFTVKAAGASTPSATGGERSPRVFIVPLPRYLNSDILNEGLGLCRGSMFRAEATIWQRFLVSPRRVFDAADADVFLVPWVPACVLHQQWALGVEVADKVTARIPGAFLNTEHDEGLRHVAAYVNTVCDAVATSTMAGKHGAVSASRLRRIVWPATKTTGASDFLPLVRPRCRRMISMGLRLSNFALAGARSSSGSGGRHCSLLHLGEPTRASDCMWLQEDVELKYGGHESVSIPYDLAHELLAAKLLEVLASRAPGRVLGSQQQPTAKELEWAASRSVSLMKWEYLVGAMVERCCTDAACGPPATSARARVAVDIPGYEWLSPDVSRLVSMFVRLQCGVDAVEDGLRMAEVAESHPCSSLTTSSSEVEATKCCADAVSALSAHEAAELAQSAAAKTNWRTMLKYVRGEEHRGWQMPSFPQWHWAAADQGRADARRHDVEWATPQRASPRCVAGAFLGTTFTNLDCGLSQRATIYRALSVDVPALGTFVEGVASGHPDFKPTAGCGLGLPAPLFRLATWLPSLDYLGEVIRARTPLAPCGWAPQNTRFYEVLALNRVPLHMCDQWRLPFLRSPKSRVAQWLRRNRSRSDLWVARSPSATVRRVELLRLLGHAVLRGFVTDCLDNGAPLNVWMVTGGTMKELLRRVSTVDDSAVDAVMSEQLPQRLFSALSWPRVSWLWAGGAGASEFRANAPYINAWELTQDALSDWVAYLDTLH